MAVTDVTDYSPSGPGVDWSQFTGFSPRFSPEQIARILAAGYDPSQLGLNPHGDAPPAPPPPFVGAQTQAPAPSGPAPAAPQGPPGYLGNTNAAFQLPQRPMSGPPGSLNPQILAAGWNMPTPSGGGGGAAMQQAPFVNPNAPAPAVQPVSSPQGPLAKPAAAAPAAAPNNDRFKLLNYDVPGGGRTPYISALNLGGLFGGGQPAVNPSAPAAAAQPVSATRRVPGPMAKNLGMGPYQKGLGPDWSDIYAARERMSQSGFQ